MADAPVPHLTHFSPEEQEATAVARRLASVRLAQLTGWRLERFGGLSPRGMPADIGFAGDMVVLPDNRIHLHFEICGSPDRFFAGGSVDAVQAEVWRLAFLEVVHGGEVP